MANCTVRRFTFVSGNCRCFALRRKWCVYFLLFFMFLCDSYAVSVDDHVALNYAHSMTIITEYQIRSRCE